MEYKTKGKEEASAMGQRKESKLWKVNKKRGNDNKRPAREKRGKADDISNFPNFSVLTTEERFAFFEALSAARKNVEKRGLPTRERFGTVHDEYLEYFAQDEKPQKKPQSASSGPGPTRSPVPDHRTYRGSATKLTAFEPPKERAHTSPKPVSPSPQRPPRLPPKHSFRPETEAIDNCESVIKKDTEKIIQMYLNKKKRIEEQWKKSALANNPPPKPTARKTPPPKIKEPLRPQSAKAATRTADLVAAKPETASDATVDNPQFQALNPAEREEFFRTLKEAHANILERNPQKRNAILSMEEVLRPYSGRRKVTTVCTATKEIHNAKERKNLRVKVTLTSGDNKRLSRTKSQIVSDSAKEGLNGRSKSLESMQSADTIHGKQSKIPVLKKAEQEKDECEDEDSRTTMKPSESLNETLTGTEERARRTRAKEETPIEEIPEERKERKREEKPKEKPEERAVKNITKEKTRIIKKINGKAEEASKVCEESGQEDGHKNVGLLKLRALNLEKRKVEFKRAWKEKERKAAEAAKKEKELQKKKKREEWLRKRQKGEMIVEMTLQKKERSKGKAKTSSEKAKPVATPKKVTKKECPNKVPMQNKKGRKEEQGKKRPMESKKEVPKTRRESREKECLEGKEEASKEAEEEVKAVEECKKSESSGGEQLATSGKEEVEEVKSCEGSVVSVRTEGSSESREGSLREEEKSRERVKSVDSCFVEGLREGCEDGATPPLVSEDVRTFPPKGTSEQMVRAACQSRKSLAGVSLVEERGEEVGEVEGGAPTYTTGKVILVDDNVIGKIRSLIGYLENKVNPKENLENEYVDLVLNYVEYLTKVTESIVRRNARFGREVHSTYAAHEVHLKFEDISDGKLREEPKKAKMPRSISDEGFNPIPGVSGIEKKRKGKPQKKTPSMEFVMMSESESSSNSEEENQAFVPASFKKADIPMTKIRLLQDLLKGRAGFTEGSIEDFKIVHYPEPEFVPREEPQEAKELEESEEDHVEKVIRMKFFRNLAKLCKCGRKQIEDDAILENLKGEAVRVDTIDKKKDPASATLNQSTMEVLKAAERKRIIDKYFKKEHS